MGILSDGRNGRKTKAAEHCTVRNGWIYFGSSLDERAQAALGSSEAYTLFEDGTSIQKFRLISLFYPVIQTDWVKDVGFVQSAVNMELTVRCEVRHGKRTWYAYRRVFGTLYKRHIGSSDMLTADKLEAVARSMPGI